MKDFRSKLLKDLSLMRDFMRLMAISGKKDYFKISLLVLILVFVVRAIGSGFLIPYAISYVVNTFGESNGGGSLLIGIILFETCAIIFIITEFMLVKFFRSLVEAIVDVKNGIVLNITKIRADEGEVPEDLVGKVANDVDFVVWNMSVTLTTLLPYALTSVVALVTATSFSPIVGALTAITLIPYLVLAEIYSRRVEGYRLEERRSYSASIAHIKDIVYGTQATKLKNILENWRKSMLKIMWLDRLYWGLGLLVGPASMGIIAYIAIGETHRGILNIGALAGLLSATLGTHTAALNAMWAMCIEGQTSAAIKRLMTLKSSMS